MNIKTINISDLITGPNVKVAAVQLQSSFYPPDDCSIARVHPEGARHPELHWHEPAQQARHQQLLELLPYLEALDPQLVTFPEYSVPRQSHAVLQGFADNHDTIVIAGSYYEGRPSSRLYRNNVCPILLPRRTRVEIAKRNLYSDEERVVASSTLRPSVARMVWNSAPNVESSISIYICLDYLAPYSHKQRKSLHDWDRPGLNVVVMDSPDLRLFEGQAGIEARELRGAGKFTLLCNTAQSARNLSVTIAGRSCLLGPTSPEKLRRGDVVEEIPGGFEGLLVAEMDLSNVRFVEKRPKRETHDPLISTDRKRLHREADQAVRLMPFADRTVRERGIAHPALLSELGLEIAIVLFSPRDSHSVHEYCRDNRIRKATIATLVGSHDFLLRFYQKRGASEMLPAFPFAKLNHTEVDETFEPKHSLKFVVRPERILKYRTAIVTNTDDYLEKASALIPKSQYSPKRREILQSISRLSTNWNPARQNKNVLDLFIEPPERVPDVGPGAGNCLRQRFVLIGLVQGDESVFEREIFDRWLLNENAARSIYGLVSDHVRDDEKFHYWVDLIADPFESDAIVEELLSRCKASGLVVALRSMDVMKYLERNSPDIGAADVTVELLSFLNAARSYSENVYNALDEDLIADHRQVAGEFAIHWQELLEIPEGSTAGMLKDLLLRFYSSWFAAHFAGRIPQRESFLKEAGRIWMSIFHEMETSATDALVVALDCDDTSELRAGIAKYFGDDDESKLRRTQGDHVLALGRFFNHSPIGEEIFGLDYRVLKHFPSDVRTKLRNPLAHGQVEKALRLDLHKTQPALTMLREVRQLTKALLLALNGVLAIRGSKM